MEEREQRWADVIKDIKCPFKIKPQVCRKDEGVTMREDWISRTAIVLTAECNFCGEKASGWGSG